MTTPERKPLKSIGKTLKSGRTLSLLVIAVLLGLLLWGRLLLRDDVPRTAVAEPDVKHTDSGPTAR